ncbi:hypothetical protein ACFY20_08955 [Streptomyces sp. NPDC001312]|uniref:hypothetical protein n=1 Tax=Streptomyces sp. NPDC001312 TaxID=3364561 RepID=UPI00367FE278
MNDDALQKALSAAGEAADDARQLELVKAVLTAQTIAQAMQPQQPACQHAHKEPANVGKWLGIGFAVCVGSVGLAVGFLAVAIAAPCATVCLLILRRIWQDMQKGR